MPKSLEQEFKRQPKEGEKTNLYIRSGQFLTFGYYAKGWENDELEYYDSSPLILVLKKSSKYILGLNFHHLPILYRKNLVKRLKNRYPDQWNSNKLLPNLTWDSIKKEVNYAEFIIKLYIIDRIYGNIARISNIDMENKYIYLKSEKFIGIKPEELWREYGLL
jgi:hypothetical protein